MNDDESTDTVENSTADCICDATLLAIRTNETPDCPEPSYVTTTLSLLEKIGPIPFESLDNKSPNDVGNALRPHDHPTSLEFSPVRQFVLFHLFNPLYDRKWTTFVNEYVNMLRQHLLFVLENSNDTSQQTNKKVSELLHFLEADDKNEIIECLTPSNDQATVTKRQRHLLSRIVETQRRFLHYGRAIIHYVSDKQKKNIHVRTYRGIIRKDIRKYKTELRGEKPIRWLTPEEIAEAIEMFVYFLQNADERKYKVTEANAIPHDHGNTNAYVLLLEKCRTVYKLHNLLLNGINRRRFMRESAFRTNRTNTPKAKCYRIAMDFKNTNPSPTMVSSMTFSGHTYVVPCIQADQNEINIMKYWNKHFLKHLNHLLQNICDRIQETTSEVHVRFVPYCVNMLQTVVERDGQPYHFHNDKGKENHMFYYRNSANAADFPYICKTMNTGFEMLIPTIVTVTSYDDADVRDRGDSILRHYRQSEVAKSGDPEKFTNSHKNAVSAVRTTDCCMHLQLLCQNDLGHSVAPAHRHQIGICRGIGSLRHAFDFTGMSAEEIEQVEKYYMKRCGKILKPTVASSEYKVTNVMTKTPTVVSHEETTENEMQNPTGSNGSNGSANDNNGIKSDAPQTAEEKTLARKYVLLSRLIDELVAGPLRCKAMHGLPQPFRLEGISGRAYEHCRNFESTKRLLEHPEGIYIVVKRRKMEHDFDETDRDYADMTGMKVTEVRKKRYGTPDKPEYEYDEYLPTMYLPGSLHEPEDLNIKTGKYILDVRRELPDTVILKEEGKNGHPQILEFGKELFPSGDHKDPNPRACCTIHPGHRVTIGPKGGNGTDGSVYSNGKMGEKHSDTVFVMDGRRDTQSYKQFSLGFKYQSTFWLFVPLCWLASIITKTDVSKLKTLVCLGLYYWDTIKTTKDEDTTLDPESETVPPRPGPLPQTVPPTVTEYHEDLQSSYAAGWRKARATPRPAFHESLHIPGVESTNWARECLNNAFYLGAPVYNAENPPSDFAMSGKDPKHKIQLNDYDLIRKPVEIDPNSDLTVNEQIKLARLKDPRPTVDYWLTEQLDALKGTVEETLPPITESVPIHDLAVHIARISMGSFARFCGDNMILDNVPERGQMAVLLDEWYALLGGVNRTRHIEPSCRLMNTVTMYQMKQSLACKKNANGQTTQFQRFRLSDSTEYKDFDDKLDHIFSSFFTATCSRTAPSIPYYVIFNRWMNLQTECGPHRKLQPDDDDVFKILTSPITADDDFLLPDENNYECFTDFLKAISHNGGKLRRGKMAKFAKTLHTASLLDASRGSVETYGSFLSDFHEQLSNYFDNATELPETVDGWIRAIEPILKNSAGDSLGKPRFLTTLIVLDVMEQFEDLMVPTGPVVYGAGAIRGSALINTSERSTEEKEDVAFLFDKYGIDESISGADRKHTIAACKLLNAYTELANESDGQHILHAMGWLQIDGVLVHAINGRPVNIYDMDQLLCKASYAQSMATGSRLKSGFPAVTQPYGWPFNQNLHRLVLENLAFVVEIAKTATAHLQSSDYDADHDVVFRDYPIPACFLFRNELDGRIEFRDKLRNILADLKEDNPDPDDDDILEQ